MQGLLYGVWGYVILTEHVCGGSVVSLLGASTHFIVRHCLHQWNMERVERSMKGHNRAHYLLWRFPEPAHRTAGGDEEHSLYISKGNMSLFNFSVTLKHKRVRFLVLNLPSHLWVELGNRWVQVTLLLPGSSAWRAENGFVRKKELFHFIIQKKLFWVTHALPQWKSPRIAISGMFYFSV